MHFTNKKVSSVFAAFYSLWSLLFLFTLGQGLLYLPTYADISIDQINTKNPQEEIWHLREKGYTAAAERLERSIIEGVRGHSLSPVGSSGSQKASVFVKSDFLGIIGIYHPQESSQKQEIATLLDRLLELNMVPLTFSIENGPKGQGSFRLYIPDADYENTSSRSFANFNRYGYPIKYWKLWLLDYLLTHSERDQFNWMTDPNQRVIATDNKAILSKRSVPFQTKSEKEVKVPDNSRKLLGKIDEIDRTELNEIIKKLKSLDRKFFLEIADQKLVDILFDNIRSILRQIEPGCGSELAFNGSHLVSGNSPD